MRTLCLLTVVACNPADQECPERQPLVSGHLPVRVARETGAPDSTADSSPPDTSGETGQTPATPTVKSSKYTCPCEAPFTTCDLDLRTEIEPGAGPFQLTTWAKCNPDFSGDAYYDLCEQGEAWDLVPQDQAGPVRDGLLQLKCDGFEALSTSEFVVYVTTFPSP